MDELRALLRRYLFGIWRHRWLAIATAWLLCCAGWVGVTLMPNTYQASARLYVDADAVLTPLLRGLALDNTVASQLEVLQRTLLSRPNLEKLISKTDLEQDVSGPADMERLVAKLGQAIRLVPQSNNLFTITYQNSRPQLAFDVVQTLVNIFIETKSGNNRSDLENARQFLQQQITSYETQLREAERKRAEFKTKYIDLLPSAANGASGLEEARAQVRRLQGQLIDAQSRRNMLADELAKTLPTIVTEADPGSPVARGNTELVEAERKLSLLLQRDTDANPEVIAQRQLVAVLRAAPAEAPGGVPGRAARNISAPNPVYQALKERAVDTDAQAGSLQRQVTDATQERDRLEQIARDAPNVQAQSLSLDRDYDVLRKNYDELIGRRESMRIAAAADTNAEKVKLEVVDPPQVPQVPVGPKRLLLTTMVLAAGLGGGGAVAVLLSQLDRAFYTLRDLRALELPIMGAISLAANPRRGLRARGVAAAGLAVVALLLLCGVYGGLVVHVLRSAA